jgi:hypothetical protein
MMSIVVPLLVLFAALSASSAGNSPPFYPDKMKLLIYRDAAGREHSIHTAADWDKRREDILANMQLVMGPLPDTSHQVPLGVCVQEEVKADKYLRRKISFDVDEARADAWTKIQNYLAAELKFPDK